MPFVATPFAHLGAEHGDKVARNSTMPHQLAALRGAAAVLTLTNVEAEGLAGYGVPPSRLHPIGGGLDPLPTGLDEETAVRERFGLPARYAIFIGRASYDKGARFMPPKHSCRLARLWCWSASFRPSLSGFMGNWGRPNKH
ncbi:MAG: hypothetical protein IPL28_21125 [Chloroflexi bacterium]|nr:hypothetical protein [Chloroflexota bacterium]